MQCACVVLYVESVTSEKNYCTWKDGDTNMEAQVGRGSLVSLLFQPRSLLRGCLLCFSPSHRRRSRSCSYHHYYSLLLTTLFTTARMNVAWGGSVGISITWLGQTWSVGRSVESCVPINHTSVGLAYSLFTLAWNVYEPVHGIVLKNGSPSVYTSRHNRCVYHTCSRVPADGCCYGYFISAWVKFKVQTACAKPLHLSGFVYTSNWNRSGPLRTTYLR